MSGLLSGSPGPHVFVGSLDEPVVDDSDLDHLAKSLRLRDGDPLTASDGKGSWLRAEFHRSGMLTPTSPAMTVREPNQPVTVAFSLTKHSKPEWVIQKLTELGVSTIVVLTSDRTIVRWDEDKVAKAKSRWERVVIEAAMQSHQVRLPKVDCLVKSSDWLSRPEVAIAHFGGVDLDATHFSVAIGPEGGWSDEELAAASSSVSLGSSVLRAETAAVAAGVLLKSKQV